MIVGIIIGFGWILAQIRGIISYFVRIPAQTGGIALAIHMNLANLHMYFAKSRHNLANSVDNLANTLVNLANL